MTASVAPSPPMSPRVRTPGRRLVVLSYHFPPDGTVGGLRWSGFTKYLSAMGWTCWVITAAPAPDPGTLPAGVIVRSYPRRRTLNDLYNWLRRPRGQREAALRSGTDEAAPPPPRKPNVLRACIDRLRLEVSMLLFLPDEGRGWMLRAAWHARRLIVQVRPDAIVSSGPPHSAHVAAWLATRGTQTRWLMDLRDPWVSPIPSWWSSHAKNQSHVTRWLNHALERLAIKSASGVVCTNPELVEAMAVRYPGATFDWVSNGVDRDLLPPRTQARFPGFGIVYAGSLYGAHDLGPVLTALRAFLDRNPRAGEQGTTLRLAGTIEPSHGERLRRQIRALRLEAHVEFLGILKREAALQLVARSRLVIVLAQTLAHQVPAKLFESVAMEIPTLVFCSAGSAAHSAAARAGATAVRSEDLQRTVHAMEDAWLGRTPVPQPTTPIDHGQLAAQVEQLIAPHGLRTTALGLRLRESGIAAFRRRQVGVERPPEPPEGDTVCCSRST